MFDFQQQMLQLLRLQRQRVFLPHQADQFDFQLRIESADHQLHRVANLADLLVLRAAHYFDILLDV